MELFNEGIQLEQGTELLDGTKRFLEDEQSEKQQYKIFGFY